MTYFQKSQNRNYVLALARSSLWTVTAAVRTTLLAIVNVLSGKKDLGINGRFQSKSCARNGRSRQATSPVFVVGEWWVEDGR